MSEVKNEVVEKKNELTASERFTNKVMKEYEGNIGKDNITEEQRKLVQGYFIGIDNTLKNSELKRNKSKNDLAFTWDNVNLPELAVKVVATSKLGLDISVKNMVHAVPYKNDTTNKYDVNLMLGYQGIKYIAEKYAVRPYKNIVCELVYSTDTFKPLKKSKDRNIESYEFEIGNPFNRGDILGGFGYIEYEDATKNKLYFMSIEEILKRKPKYASVEFWGGEKDKWENKKVVGKEKVEGWYPEMCQKTLERFVYGKIEIDPKRIAEINQATLSLESDTDEIENEIMVNANKEEIDVIDADYTEVNYDTETGEILEEKAEVKKASDIDSDF